MPLYMLDTDISSYIMNQSSGRVLRRLLEVSVSDVCISAITRSELEYGVEVSPRQERDRQSFNHFLRHFAVLDYPGAAAADYARIRAVLKERGSMIGAHDLFIAAHAICLDLTLVTNNTREFSRVPGLKIDNWA
jgi:tRNA(fMet)-specific endonuclease VapC